jgi:hypothetical protein
MVLSPGGAFSKTCTGNVNSADDSLFIRATLPSIFDKYIPSEGDTDICTVASLIQSCPPISETTISNCEELPGLTCEEKLADTETTGVPASTGIEIERNITNVANVKINIFAQFDEIIFNILNHCF